MSAQIIEEARQQVADAIHAHSLEIYFTGCATESNNAVLKSLSNHFYPEKKKIILDALKDAGRTAQLLAVLGPGPDHPVNLAHAEGRYLKGRLLALSSR